MRKSIEMERGTIIINVSEKIVTQLIEKKIIKKEEIHLYQYSMELFISTVINIAIILFIGFFFSKLGETAIFLLFFCLLKRYTGGLHMPTYKSCIVTFSSIYLFLMFSDNYWFQLPSYVFAGLVMISLAVIMIFAPVEDRNRPLSVTEVIRLKRKIKYILPIEVCLFMLGTFIEPYKEVARFIGFGVIVVGVLVILGQVKNKIWSGDIDD